MHARELIALGTLNDTVEDEDVAERLGLEHEHVLVERLFGVEDAPDLEGHRHPWPLRRDLAEPAACARGCSVRRAEQTSEVNGPTMEGCVSGAMVVKG
jgi:hypothetical protein